MDIYIKQVLKKDNRIEIIYEQMGLDKYLDISQTPYWEYNQCVEDVPDSIAVVPFIANLLPMIFTFNVRLHVKEIDKSFLGCIAEYRKGYQEMIPMFSFSGEVIADAIVDNKYLGNKNCLMFSGGIDATCSLAKHDDELDDCITIWGSDIRSENRDGWNKMSASIEDCVTKYSKHWCIIRSNFREYLNEAALGLAVEKCGDSWWHAFQHGIAILGQVAPLAFLNKYNKIFIASSFTKDHRAICASDPLTDNCFKVGSAYAIHDGFEYDRCQKVKIIFDSIAKKNITLNLHVCWESDSGKNCGHCEKCIRSYLNCRAMNCDPRKIGIIPTISMREIKNRYYHSMEFDDNAMYRAIIIIIINAKKTYGNNPPEDLKWLIDFNPEKVNSSLYWKIKRLYRRVRYGQKKE